MTTRRVIVLVLTMLLVLPFLRTDSADNVPPSSYYGADEVYSKWMQWSKRPSRQDDQLRYENSLLKYLYYHNWYTRSCDDMKSNTSSTFTIDCPAWYYSHIFWIGMTGTKEAELQQRVNSTQVRLSTVKAWNNYAAQPVDIYQFGTVPNDVMPVIAGEWSTTCSDSSSGIYRRGFSLIGRETDEVSYAVPCPSDLRPAEKMTFYPRLMPPGDWEAWHFVFYFDSRPYTRAEAFFGILITAFICIVLVVASIYFSMDANNLVLKPVEHMIKRVDIIRRDPLVAMRMADEEFKKELDHKAKARQRHSTLIMPTTSPLLARLQMLKNTARNVLQCHQRGTYQAPMETVILEKTIIKLGSMLALGFGQAGANIIGHNLSGVSAGVNVMIPGTKVECVIGKARIQDFSTATEVLQANVMTFVNQIAEIVHGVVDALWGGANKNNGDTFLLIWRIPSDMDDESASKLADMSMLSFAKILGAVHAAPVLAAYRSHPGLQQRLGSQCRVCLTFGLHAGWAIEGAVGTEFKIDASYLSPNVSIASSVEMSTKIYSVPIMISQSVIEMASEAMVDKCRLVDQVLMRGSTQPLGLYSLDLDYLRAEVEPPRSATIEWNQRARFKVRQFLEAEKEHFMFQCCSIAEEFEKDRVITSMRKRYTVNFLMMFHMGLQNYIHGEWEVARRLLSQARYMMRARDDGPSTALLRFMSVSDFVAPDSWMGIRELTL